MSAPDLLVVLVAAIVMLTPLAPRVGVPQPVLLTLFGLGVGLLPVIPQLEVPPELILPLVLPPLLFAAAQRTSVQEFSAAARPVLLLAVGLTFASAAAIAVAAHALGVPSALAWVLGAIVSPPDPIAATAVSRRLALPRPVVAVLEGEGLFNDVTALVLYRVALAAAVTGQFSVLDGLLRLVASVVGGAAIGLAGGWLVHLALRRFDDPAAEITLTLAAPYVIYLSAERLQVSGVLAVLITGLYTSSRAKSALSSGGFLLGRQVWAYTDFAIGSIAFAFLGVELARVLAHGDIDTGTLRLGLAVLGVLVLGRILWVFPAAWVARRRHRPHATPGTWRETAVIAWSGMRGVVTVATALALPLTDDAGRPLPWRAEVIAVALGTVLMTLLLQGLTLSPLVKALDVAEETDEGSEVIRLRQRAAQAALRRLQAHDDPADDGPRAVLVRQYEGLVHTPAAVHDISRDHPERWRSLQQLRTEAIEAEREVVLEARARGEVPLEVADRVLADVERRAIRGHV